MNGIEWENKWVTAVVQLLPSEVSLSTIPSPGFISASTLPRSFSYGAILSLIDVLWVWSSRTASSPLASHPGLPKWLSLDPRRADQAKERHLTNWDGGGVTAGWLLHPVRSFLSPSAGLEPWDPLCTPVPSRYLQITQDRIGEHLYLSEALRNSFHLVQTSIIAHLDDSQGPLTVPPTLLSAEWFLQNANLILSLSTTVSLLLFR